MSRRLTAVALASHVFGLGAAVAYIALRSADYLRGQVTDPLSVVYEVHTAFYWRAAIALWWGGCLALLTFLFVGNDAHRAERLTTVVGALTFPVVAVLAALAWWLP